MNENIPITLEVNVDKDIYEWLLLCSCSKNILVKCLINIKLRECMEVETKEYLNYVAEELGDKKVDL